MHPFFRHLLLFSLLFALTHQTAAQQADRRAPAPRYDRDVLPPSFHGERRDSVLDALPDSAVAVFFSAPRRTRENDVRYEYRQSSDLYYLTGIEEPGTVLLLASGGVSVDGAAVQELLMVPPRPKDPAVWEAPPLGTRRARDVSGVDRVVSNERFEEIVGPLLADSTRPIYHLPLPESVEPGTALQRQLAFFEDHLQQRPSLSSPMIRQAVQLMLTVDDPDRFQGLQRIFGSRYSAQYFDHPFWKKAYTRFVEADTFTAWQTWRQRHVKAEYVDSVLLREVLDRLRMVKTDEELAMLQQAIDITARAHRRTIQAIEPGMYEYEVEALVEYVFKRSGAEYTGFPSIIGSGPNATVLHYEKNRRQMEANDMVVMDVGAEYRGYTADITRSVPVDGDFSSEEEAIYALVLEAQREAIEAAEAGAPFSITDETARRVIAEGLQELGLIDAPDEVSRFFMHGTSHHLGLYVHDVSSGSTLVPGAVITVEPGIYIRPSEDVPERWWNIGVRIEDDVLITDDGPRVLSKEAPKSIARIETLMRQNASIEP